jgi:hypothetical protein
MLVLGVKLWGILQLSFGFEYIMKIKSILCVLGTLFTTACNTGTVMQSTKTASAVWGDDMTYEYIEDQSRQYRQALSIAKKKGNYKNYALQYRLGNLVVIDASTPPPRSVMDVNSTKAAVGVLLGSEPQYVVFPDRAMFAHFMKMTRKDPLVIHDKADVNGENQKRFAWNLRLRMTLLLATGSDSYMSAYDFQSSVLQKMFEKQQLKPHEPSWKDEDGILTIQFYRLRANGMMAEIPTICTLVVDEKQQFTYQCKDIMDGSKNKELNQDTVEHSANEKDNQMD